MDVALVDVIRRHWMRAVRVDKPTYAALEATLGDAAGRGSSTIPVQQMLTPSAEAIRRVPTTGRGDQPGGRLESRRREECRDWREPAGVELPTWLVSVVKDSLSAAAVEEKLRASVPSLPASNRTAWSLDLRTV